MGTSMTANGGAGAQVKDWTPARPMVCKPWCEYGDHSDVFAREDQVCFGVDHRVDMTLRPVVEESIYDEATSSWQAGPDHLRIYVSQQADAAEPTVRIEHEAGDYPLVQFDLRPEEAQALIAQLQAALKEIGAEK